MSMREHWDQIGWEAGYHGKPIEGVLTDRKGLVNKEYADKRDAYVRSGYAEGVKERERKNGVA